MTRAVVFSDAHVDAGQHLGEPDPEWGSTRLHDARRTLETIVAQPCDVLVFGGDLTAGPSASPAAVAMVQEVLRLSDAPIVLQHGNHDHGGQARSLLHVVAAGLRDAVVLEEPQLLDVGGVQIGALPWAPPQRLYTRAGGQAEGHAVAADALVDLARGMAARLDAGRPSLLIAHWLLAGSRLASGADILLAAEPLVPVAELEGSGEWSAIIGGHNHEPQQLSDRTWVVGAPWRTSFGEAHLQPRALIVEWDDAGVCTVESLELPDRALATVDLDVVALLAGAPPDLGGVAAGAVVRLVASCTDAQARALHADDAAIPGAVVDACMEAGAAKVIGPQLRVTRERRARSDLGVDADPAAALDDWLGRQDLDEDVRAAVRERAAAIIAGEDLGPLDLDLMTNGGS